MGDNKQNSTQATPAQVVGAVYSSQNPAPVDGQGVPLQVDAEGNLKVNVEVGGGGGGNVNITGVDGSPPALSNPLPVELSDGASAFGTSGNPLSVAVVSGGGSNPSVGSTGQVAPTSATEVGGVNPQGNLQALAVSSTGNQLVQDGTPGDNSVMKEILSELRMIRKLLFMLYEESGEGAPTLLDDVDESNSVDYTN